MAKLTRYERNIGLEGITIENQEKLFNSKVIVMGAGGLGSGVIANLSALGVGQIKIIDDKVLNEKDLNTHLIHKYRNIGRAKVMSAKDWIGEFNSDVRVELEKIKLNELNYFGVISDYDIIVDCFNSFETKYILNEIALRHNKILVHGAAQGFIGQVTTIVPSKSACLACINQKSSVLGVDNSQSISPIDGVISSIQANEVLKAIIGGELLTNKMLIFDGYKSRFSTLDYCKDPNCSACKDYANV